MSKKSLYLLLASIGFLLPNYFVFLESIETGNLLLYAHPLDTIRAMFSNRISSIFAIDLFFAVFVFFIWSYRESRTRSIPRLWLVWLTTLLFGFACGLPLFLYLVETKTTDFYEHPNSKRSIL